MQHQARGKLKALSEQEWIYKTMQTNEIDVEGIINGPNMRRSAAFLQVHTLGMLALVTDSTRMVPETLSFDEYRLDLLRAEYRYLCLASSMLVTLSSVVPRVEVLSTVSEMFVAAREMDVDKVVSDICMVAGQHLGQYLRQSAKPTDAVHMLM